MSSMRCSRSESVMVILGRWEAGLSAINEGTEKGMTKSGGCAMMRNDLHASLSYFKNLVCESSSTEPSMFQ